MHNGFLPHVPKQILLKANRGHGVLESIPASPFERLEYTHCTRTLEQFRISSGPLTCSWTIESNQRPSRNAACERMARGKRMWPSNQSLSGIYEWITFDLSSPWVFLVCLLSHSPKVVQIIKLEGWQLWFSTFPKPRSCALTCDHSPHWATQLELWWISVINVFACMLCIYWNNFKMSLRRSFKLWTIFLYIKASFGSY